MIPRVLANKIKQLSSQFPVVAILGPRQSGKSTLSKMLFPTYTYVSLEDPDVRAFAERDARRFLTSVTKGEGVILDEVQKVPDLLSYIQGIVDAQKRPGFFVLTGSQNFLLHSTITQTLAGRVALCSLLPFSLEELGPVNGIKPDLEDMLFLGGYPRLFDDGISPLDWYPRYISTYVERDVRLVKNVEDLSTFQRFLGLCAGRIGQLLNIASLASDCGISPNTARSWLSLLEASYIIFLAQPHFRNFSKRLIKSPKLYFYDTGLACSLLQITASNQIHNHYLRGGLFESFVMSELHKYFFNRGLRPPLYFWRDKQGHEVDVIVEKADQLLPIEVKSGSTINSSYFDELRFWSELSGSLPENNIVVYGGLDNQQRSSGHVVSWQTLKNPTWLATFLEA